MKSFQIARNARCFRANTRSRSIRGWSFERVSLGRQPGQLRAKPLGPRNLLHPQEQRIAKSSTGRIVGTGILREHGCDAAQGVDQHQPGPELAAQAASLFRSPRSPIPQLWEERVLGKLAGEAPAALRRQNASPGGHDDAGLGLPILREKGVVAQRQVGRQHVLDIAGRTLFEHQLSADGPWPRNPCVEHATGPAP